MVRTVIKPKEIDRAKEAAANAIHSLRDISEMAVRNGLPTSGPVPIAKQAVQTSERDALILDRPGPGQHPKKAQLLSTSSYHSLRRGAWFKFLAMSKYSWSSGVVLEESNRRAPDTGRLLSGQAGLE